MTLRGIDVSEYQGVVDWSAVKRSGIAFAAAKATEGLGFQDPTFPHNWEGMKARHIVRGAYHFFRPEFDGAAQADFFHDYVRRHGHFTWGDFIVLDIEQTDGMPTDQVVSRAADFIRRCQLQIAKPVFIYTGFPFWQELGSPRDSIFTRCPLWIANYPEHFVETRFPPYPNQWPVLSFWQFAQDGRVPGIHGAVDLDLFLGSELQLKILVGLAK